MKKKALLALGLCLALTFPLLAQEKEIKEIDSVYITPFAGSKIILVGKNIKKLLKENNLDVLKTKFIQDYQESTKDKDFPATAKNMIYLAGQDGRRRLKAVPDETVPLKVEDEIAAFKSNLPAYHYTIFDLTKNYEYHIYVKGPEDLDSLKKVNVTSLIANSRKEKHQLNINYATAVEIKQTDSGAVYNRVSGQHFDLLGLEPVVGLGFINSSFSPTIGGNLSFTHQSKYGKKSYQAGLRYNFYLLTDFSNKAFTNFYPISSSDLFFLKFYGKTGLGLSIGKFWSDGIFNSTRKGSLDKAWKVGFISSFKGFELEYNFIFDKQKHTNTGLTIRF